MTGHRRAAAVTDAAAVRDAVAVINAAVAEVVAVEADHASQRV